MRRVPAERFDRDDIKWPPGREEPADATHPAVIPSTPDGPYTRRLRDDEEDERC